LQSPCCLCVCSPPPPPPINLWTLEPNFMKIGIYVMAPDSISEAYLIKPSHRSVCLSLISLLGKAVVKCIWPLIVRQQLNKDVPAAMNTQNNRRIVVRLCLWDCPCIPISLVGSDWVKMFPWQQRIAGGVIFYAVHVVWKESRQLVLPRASCLKLNQEIVTLWIQKPSNFEYYEYFLRFFIIELFILKCFLCFSVPSKKQYIYLGLPRQPRQS
jgi:hypothetical protein